MNRSSSRSSYPMDKMLPKTITYGRRHDRVQPGKVIKQMHKKKQRDWNRKLNKNYEDE